MTTTTEKSTELTGETRMLIDGQLTEARSGKRFDNVNPATEEVLGQVADASVEDMEAAVAAARRAYDETDWSTNKALRKRCLEQLQAALEEEKEAIRSELVAEVGTPVMITYGPQLDAPLSDGLLWPARMIDEFEWERDLPPGTAFGMTSRRQVWKEPAGVVGAIIPWNAPLQLISHKIGPALLAGCSVVLKLSPEAPGEGYLVAEAAEQIGLPPGVFNVVTADREVSELLVRDPRVDKITFTGSTAAGRKIASLCGERVARCTLELGGKSAAVVLDDADIATVAASIAGAECIMTGQVCSSLTRIVVTRDRHDEMVEALAENFAQVRVGDPFDQQTQMGPLAMSRQRDRVEGYIAKGIDEGATLAAGGGRPKDLERGWFIEPTVFGNVDNSSTIAQEEIFGPVLSVIPADDERDAVRIANDTIYGLNSSVFTNDVDRAREVAGQLRAGTVGHNAFKTDFGIAFGGFKQSGIGREGGKEGLLPFLETKTVILDGPPSGYPTPEG